jgi:predicted Zn-dependent peptidase
MQEFNLHQFPNGLRLIHKQVPYTKLVHCGFVLDIGSRDESPAQQGMAHFWEHMAFKGTKRRNAYHILNRLDSVGGELNAYTTREKICFYATTLDKYLPQATELLTDITFNSVFPEKQIEKERGVILEEMSMYEDSPEDALQDNLDSLIFNQHSLGHNILGTPETLKSFARHDFLEFINQHLDSTRTIFSVVGNISFQKAVQIASRYWKDIPEFKSTQHRTNFTAYQPRQQTLRKHISQAHFAMGRTAFSLADDRRLAFVLLTNILGGPANTSRLNLALREKRGYVYGVDASYVPYTDDGYFGITFATEGRQLKRAISQVEKEMLRLAQKPLGSLQLHYAKEQLVGQLAMAEENNASLMLMMGKSILDLERIESLEDIFHQIRSIAAAELQALASEMFRPEDFSRLYLLPEN